MTVVRIYLPANTNLLRHLHTEGEVPAQVAFTVDSRLLTTFDVDHDDEEVAEFIAMQLAAEHAYELSPGTVVVIAADVTDEGTVAGDDAGEVRVTNPVSLAQVVSIHVGTVGGGGGASEVDASDLGWWAVQELPALLASLE